MTDAIILHAPLRPSSTPPWLDRLLQALPYAHRLELERRDADARRASLLALGLALVAVERIGGRSFSPGAFSFPAGGKPWLRNGPHFSVSHAKTRVACLASLPSDGGLDVEDCTSPADAVDPSQLLRWTATEAALKAAGLGLRSARKVTLTNALDTATVGGQRYVLQAVTGLSDCVAHVASPAGLSFAIDGVDLAGDDVSAALERSFGLPPQFE